MGSQGKPLSEAELIRIVQFLSSTEMTVGDIAARMGCSPSTIVSINRRFQVRDYAGFRSSWKTQLRVGIPTPGTVTSKARRKAS